MNEQEYEDRAKRRQEWIRAMEEWAWLFAGEDAFDLILARLLERTER